MSIKVTEKDINHQVLEIYYECELCNKRFFNSVDADCCDCYNKVKLFSKEKDYAILDV